MNGVDIKRVRDSAKKIHESAEKIREAFKVFGMSNFMIRNVRVSNFTISAIKNDKPYYRMNERY